jgi:hypothetical protein
VLPGAKAAGTVGVRPPCLSASLLGLQSSGTYTSLMVSGSSATIRRHAVSSSNESVAYNQHSAGCSNPHADHRQCSKPKHAFQEPLSCGMPDEETACVLHALNVLCMQQPTTPAEEHNLT